MQQSGEEEEERGDECTRRDHVPLERQLRLPPPLQCPQRDPRDKVSPALGQLPGLPDITKLLLSPGHPELSFLLRASTELQLLSGSCRVPHSTVTGREKTERNVIAAINL